MNKNYEVFSNPYKLMKTLPNKLYRSLNNKYSMPLVETKKPKINNFLIIPEKNGNQWYN